MTFIAEGFVELLPGFVQTATKITRDSVAGFYNITLADGGVVNHVKGKYLTFRSFSDDSHAPKHVEHAKTYPARYSDVYSETQRPYEQLTLW